MKTLKMALSLFLFISMTGVAAETGTTLKSRTIVELYEKDKEVLEPQAPAMKKVAIFTANRGAEGLNDQMPIFEDMMTAQVTDLGFEVISREMVVGATGDLLKRSEKNSLDALLDDQTSSLRLAQTLGADYLLFASFMGLDQEQRSVKAYGVNYDNYIYTLRASYRVLDGNTGGSLTAGMVEPTRTIQQTKHSATSTAGLVRELLSKASREMASSLKQKNNQRRIRNVQAATENVEIHVGAVINDINFPQAVIDGDGNVTIQENKGMVEALSVTVELDGFAIGTTGEGLASFSVPPGVHRIRLVRDDLVPYERMINAYAGMKLNLALQLNAVGLRRWRENTAVLQTLLERTNLNDAQVEQMRGAAQMLRQSGYKVDIKVDTDEGIKVKQNQSLFNQN